MRPDETTKPKRPADDKVGNLLATAHEQHEWLKEEKAFDCGGGGRGAPASVHVGPDDTFGQDTADTAHAKITKRQKLDHVDAKSDDDLPARSDIGEDACELRDVDAVSVVNQEGPATSVPKAASAHDDGVKTTTEN
eukprot:SAG31_NODE_6138_length_2153_cov_1.119279_1_plen_135_part_10